MKKQKFTLVIAVSIAICFILSSCGVIKNNDFSSRKYTHFKKGESTIVMNPIKSDKKISNEPITAKLIKTNSEIKNVENNNQVIEKTTASNQQKTKNKTSNFRENNFFKSKVVRKEKVQRISNFMMKHLINKPSTASTERGGRHSFLMLVIVVLLVLILLGMLGILSFIVGALLYILLIVLLVLLIMWLLGMMH